MFRRKESLTGWPQLVVKLSVTHSSLCSFPMEIKIIEELQLISIRCCVKISGKTGVEMEALTGVTVAALTIYDMCKAITHNMVIKEARLIEKSGGKRTVKEGNI